VVDEDCDVQDIGEVTLRVANTLTLSATSSSRWGLSTRWTMRAACPTTAARWASTQRASGRREGFERPWPAMIEMDAATKARVDALWDRLGILI